MGVYTVRLVAARVAGSASWTSVYVVPTGRAIVVRDVVATNVSSTATEFNLALVKPGSGDRVYILATASLAASQSLRTDIRARLLEGETLQVFVSQLVTVLVTGYDFQAPS